MRGLPTSLFRLGPSLLFTVLVLAAAAVGDNGCSPGLWGPRCVKRCHCLQASEACDFSGHCLSGCAAGYTGRDCSTECPPGNYGPDCAHQCQCDVLCACNAETGDCDTPQCLNVRRGRFTAQGISSPASGPDMAVVISLCFVAMLLLVTCLLVFCFCRRTERGERLGRKARDSFLLTARRMSSSVKQKWDTHKPNFMGNRGGTPAESGAEPPFNETYDNVADGRAGTGPYSGQQQPHDQASDVYENVPKDQQMQRSPSPVYQEMNACEIVPKRSHKKRAPHPPAARDCVVEDWEINELYENVIQMDNISIDSKSLSGISSAGKRSKIASPNSLTGQLSSSPTDTAAVTQQGAELPSDVRTPAQEDNTSPQGQATTGQKPLSPIGTPPLSPGSLASILEQGAPSRFRSLSPKGMVSTAGRQTPPESEVVQSHVQQSSMRVSSSSPASPGEVSVPPKRSASSPPTRTSPKLQAILEKVINVLPRTSVFTLGDNAAAQEATAVKEKTPPSSPKQSPGRTSPRLSAFIDKVMQAIPKKLSISGNISPEKPGEQVPHSPPAESQGRKTPTGYLTSPRFASPEPLNRGSTYTSPIRQRSPRGQMIRQAVATFEATAERSSKPTSPVRAPEPIPLPMEEVSPEAHVSSPPPASRSPPPASRSPPPASKSPSPTSPSSPVGSITGRAPRCAPRSPAVRSAVSATDETNIKAVPASPRSASSSPAPALPSSGSSTTARTSSRQGRPFSAEDGVKSRSRSREEKKTSPPPWNPSTMIPPQRSRPVPPARGRSVKRGIEMFDQTSYHSQKPPPKTQAAASTEPVVKGTEPVSPPTSTQAQVARKLRSPQAPVTRTSPQARRTSRSPHAPERGKSPSKTSPQSLIRKSSTGFLLRSPDNVDV